MKKNLLYIISLGVFMSLALSSCIKNEDEELGDRGSTFVKLLEAPEKKLFFAPFSNTRAVDLFSLRRDVPSMSEMNTSLPVKVTLVPGYIDRYNTANGTDYEALPDSLFTTSIPKTGNTYDFTLAPGESGKEFTIQLNGGKWNLEHTYAMAFALSDVGGKKISSGKDTVIALLSVINAWDGVYEVTGNMVDRTNATLTGYLPMTYHLITAGPTTVVGYDPDIWGDYFVPIYSGTSLSGYGSFAPIFEIDPATNKIISVKNYYGQPAGNTRSAQLDPSGANQYYSDTRTIDVKFFMLQPSVVTAAPHIRVEFDWHMKYTGPR